MAQNKLRFYGEMLSVVYDIKFGPCPCGFFCSECLLQAIAIRGFWGGLGEHLLFHTPIGMLYLKVKYK